MAYLNTDIRYCKGIGEKKAQLLNKLGVFTVRDLVSYFPRKYEDRSRFTPIAAAFDGEAVCIHALIASEPRLVRIRRGVELVKFRAVDDSGAVDITYFNQPYLKNSIHRGEYYNFFGRMVVIGSERSMVNPVHEAENAPFGVTGRIIPVYRLTTGLSQKSMMLAMRSALDAAGDELPDVLPSSVREKYKLAQTIASFLGKHMES